MKYLIVLGDGMADYKCPDLGGKTPLQYAVTPNMDSLAQKGRMGLVKTVAEGFSPGSDVANLSVMGYDPAVYYTGRAPLEAVSMGVQLKENDIAFRCNLVTLSGEGIFMEKTMLDYSAGEIDSDRAAVLITDLGRFLQKDKMQFYPGISYRHLMVWSGGAGGTCLTPPHDISGKRIADFIPKGCGSEEITSIMEESFTFLSAHYLNNENILVKPANSVWLWGQGRSPSLKIFKEKYSLSGAVISAVDLIRGIGICAGMKIIEVEGITGNIHTNFTGKAIAAIEAFRKGADLVYLHIEAPDEAGHQGSTSTKVRAIEQIDSKVLGLIIPQMDQFGEYKIMVLPDHPTPLSLMTHTSDPVPFVVYDSRHSKENSDQTYCEDTAANGIYIERGHELMDFFVRD